MGRWNFKEVFRRQKNNGLPENANVRNTCEQSGLPDSPAYRTNRGNRGTRASQGTACQPIETGMGLGRQTRQAREEGTDRGRRLPEQGFGRDSSSHFPCGSALVRHLAGDDGCALRNDWSPARDGANLQRRQPGRFVSIAESRKGNDRASIQGLDLRAAFRDRQAHGIRHEGTRSGNDHRQGLSEFDIESVPRTARARGSGRSARARADSAGARRRMLHRRPHDRILDQIVHAQGQDNHAWAHHGRVERGRVAQRTGRRSVLRVFSSRHPIARGDNGLLRKKSSP